MRRVCVFALLVLMPAAAGFGQVGGKKEKDTTIAGKLTENDPKDKVRNSASQVHVVNMKAGNAYTITMVSKEFDSFLRLEDKDGKQLAEDDDSGGDLNAQIVFPCRKDGDYRVICCAFAENGMGNYTLTVKSSADNAKYTTAHEVLMAKAAPDFRSDFTVTSKTVKLSDFKGKVVVVEFVDLRFDDCVAAVGQLRDLRKTFHTAGLEAVSVTSYKFEIGQKVGFDKASGKLTKVDQADKSSEQAALKAFAAHHKLEHPLMVLAKDEAMKAFDAYAVNGVPQTVLIDRQGVVRMIHVGDTKSAPTLATEIKKLLAEKK
ncbi:MAG TPA: TlpA disulfide reductase family protein [Gemmataceae bacterium]|nr:TlpA disulfide reductase family protein [Gemmataceae bacterium]